MGIMMSIWKGARKGVEDWVTYYVDINYEDLPHSLSIVVYISKSLR